MTFVFATGGGYPPEFFGGVQSSIHQSVLRLQTKNQDATVLASLFGGGWFGLKARAKLKVSMLPAVSDDISGYTVWRAWDPAQAVQYVIDKIKPSVAIVQCHQTIPIAKAFRRAGIPVVVYLRNVEFEELGGDIRDISECSFIANSNFTSKKYEDTFDIKSKVIPPLIEYSKYHCESSREVVTFVNPCSKKGLEIALKLAELCPEIPFQFVESWALSKNDQAELHSRLNMLRNVTFVPSTADMRKIFRTTKILLAPSKWEEAWGRVASEAHCSGIPVLGSDRGGLPEAIGPGGMVLNYSASIDCWVEALQRMWTDHTFYDGLSEAAFEYAKRPEMDPEYQIEQLLEVVHLATAVPV